MPLLSVIIPVYNVQDYIGECFESIIMQNTDCMEVICIDDGSTDDSGKICDEYAKKNANIIVVHQENKGVAAARNLGLKLASGEYIAWIDPDDYISENWFEIISVKLENSIDIVFFDYTLVRNKKRIEKKFASVSQYISKDFFLEALVLDQVLQSQLWQKVFKKELFEDIVFPENVICMEDYAVLHKIVLKTENIYYISESLYFYRLREKSLVNTVDVIKSINCYLISKERYQYLLNLGVSVSNLGYLMQALGVCVQFYKTNNNIRQKHIYELNECKHEINSNIKSIIFNGKCNIVLKLKFLLCYLGLLNVVIIMYKSLKKA